MSKLRLILNVYKSHLFLTVFFAAALSVEPAHSGGMISASHSLVAFSNAKQYRDDYKISAPRVSDSALPVKVINSNKEFVGIDQAILDIRKVKGSDFGVFGGMSEDHIQSAISEKSKTAKTNVKQDAISQSEKELEAILAEEEEWEKGWKEISELGSLRDDEAFDELINRSFALFPDDNIDSIEDDNQPKQVISKNNVAEGSDKKEKQALKKSANIRTSDIIIKPNKKAAEKKIISKNDNIKKVISKKSEKKSSVSDATAGKKTLAAAMPTKIIDYSTKKKISNASKEITYEDIEKIFLQELEVISKKSNKKVSSKKSRKKKSSSANIYSNAKWVWPVDTRAKQRISSPFGYRVHPVTKRRSFHKGVDIAAPRGTRVFASRNGVVESVTRHRYLGKYVKIRHNDGSYALYGHLSRWNVKRGNVVKAGQTIGRVGSSGRSTGPHLDFSIRVKEKAVNPMRHLTVPRSFASK